MKTTKIRYHLQLSEHRTTISLDKIISELMAVKLGKTPNTKEAHQKVRQTLDTFIELDRGRAGHGLTRYITEQAILFISDKEVADKYEEWWSEQYDKDLL